MKIRVLWILIILVCISIVGYVCTKYLWRNLEDEYVTVKDQNMHFTIVHYENGLELRCTSPCNNPSNVQEQFEDAVVYGVSDIPSGMLQDPFPWRNKRIREDKLWPEILESAPMVYLDIENERIVRYLAIESWLPGLKGSRVGWITNMNMEGSWLRDKYSFTVLTMNTPIQLTPVQCSPLEDNRGLLLETEYPYYLLTDAGLFGHLGSYFGTFELDNQVQGYWIIVNKTDISRGTL
jgi:hypothetical protein